MADTPVPPPITFSRADAQLLVDGVTGRTSAGYLYVMLADALALLGPANHERMLRNPVRSRGPLPDTVYPWNVVDYLSGYRTPQEIYAANNQRKLANG